MDRYTLFLMIPLVTLVYRFIFPMDYILTPILLQKQLLNPLWKQRCTETQCCACATNDYPTVACSFPLTHVYNRSCQMKRVLNLDAFLGTTAIWEVVTDFVLPNVFERALQLTRHNHVPMLRSTLAAHHTIAQAPKGQHDKLVPNLFHFFAERFKLVVLHDVKPNQIPPPGKALHDAVHVFAHTTRLGKFHRVVAKPPVGFLKHGIVKLDIFIHSLLTATKHLMRGGLKLLTVARVVVLHPRRCISRVIQEPLHGFRDVLHVVGMLLFPVSPTFRPKAKDALLTRLHTMLFRRVVVGTTSSIVMRWPHCGQRMGTSESFFKCL
ncbi:hypothetical protein NPIL_657711 [Nephila pilipes]|uniref:Uncharacterized protein n=1 Tax=Nephila pilipes TaxID=299642 RepID=A0A8X6TML4_NEPPI|nr:hypothetical protein NPIL_657711 [Nephila pilipes]